MEVKRNNAAICPSCERFIGPAEVCPYCEADANKPPILRGLRYTALSLAMVGLVFLYLMVRNREVPLLPIGTVTPMMNFAGVRIAGTVENSPYIKRKGNDVEFLSFYVNDGTGELQITVSKEKARKWVEEKRIPGKGDRVELGGTLNVSSDGKIRLRASRISLDRERSLKKNNSELNQRSEK